MSEPESREPTHLERFRALRPKERVIKRLVARRLSTPEIAWRLRCSPAHVQRTLRWSDIPRSPRPRQAEWETSPIERTVLRARWQGATEAEIAARLRRSPEFVRRIEKHAEYRQTQARKSGGAAAETTTPAQEDER